MDVQAFVPQCSVKGFDEDLVGWLAWTREGDACFVVIRRKINKLTGKLGTIIGEQIFRSAAEPDKPVEDLDNVLAS